MRPRLGSQGTPAPDAATGTPQPSITSSPPPPPPRSAARVKRCMRRRLGSQGTPAMDAATGTPQPSMTSSPDSRRLALVSAGKIGPHPRMPPPPRIAACVRRSPITSPGYSRTRAGRAARPPV
jgi:hypothetical protein